jgi:broad specificity phosphatase PhoE
VAPAKPEVVLVRHGETEWTREGRHTGKSDIPLTEHGRRQAEALRRELAGWRFGLVLTSPLQRAMETCRLAGYGQAAQTRPDLVEWDYGRYDGLTSKQIAITEPDWSLWRDGGPGGEQPADVGRRADRIIAEVRRATANVLIFAHGHVLRVLTARWLSQAPAAGQHYALQPAALSVLGYEHENPVIWQWNRPPSG